MSEPTLSDLAKCARREAAMRRRVYPRWIDNGKMTQDQADHETACMDAIAKLLSDMEQKEQPSLFELP
jgi:hypothetical protein